MGQKRIRLDEKMFELDEYIKKSIELCNSYGGALEIDANFCVFAIYDHKAHWIGYAAPHDISWFEAQFKSDSGGKYVKKTRNTSEN